MRTIPGRKSELDKRSIMMQRLYNGLNKIPFILSARRYNLTISHEKKFVWFRAAKVATRTILHHLGRCEVSLDVEHANFIFYPPKVFDDYFKFAFVRNPWGRLISCWNDKVIKKNSFRFDESDYKEMRNFEKFVDFVSTLNIERCDRHLRLQAALIDLNNIDYLGRLETFDKDFKYVLQRLHLPEKEVISRNVTFHKKPYQEYYSEDLVKKVYQIYRKDIQIFGYQF